MIGFNCWDSYTLEDIINKETQESYNRILIYLIN